MSSLNKIIMLGLIGSEIKNNKFTLFTKDFSEPQSKFLPYKIEVYGKLDLSKFKTGDAILLDGIMKKDFIFTYSMKKSCCNQDSDIDDTINRVFLIGCVGRNPEKDKFSIATKEYQSGEYITDWHNILCLSGQVSDYAKKYILKGDTIYIEGFFVGDTIHADKITKLYNGRNHPTKAFN